MYLRFQWMHATLTYSWTRIVVGKRNLLVRLRVRRTGSPTRCACDSRWLFSRRDSCTMIILYLINIDSLFSWNKASSDHFNSRKIFYCLRLKCTFIHLYWQVYKQFQSKHLSRIVFYSKQTVSSRFLFHLNVLCLPLFYLITLQYDNIMLIKPQSQVKNYLFVRFLWHVLSTWTR